MTTTPASPSQPTAPTSRREFICMALLTLGTAWLGTWLQSRLFPKQSRTAKVTPVSFPLAELPVGESKAITYGGDPAIVLHTPESIRAFSLVCTHLGCTLQWQADKNEFYCPCHDGLFDQFGDVIAGLPPIPLEQYPVRLEDELVIVGYV